MAPSLFDLAVRQAASVKGASGAEVIERDAQRRAERAALRALQAIEAEFAERRQAVVPGMSASLATLLAAAGLAAGTLTPRSGVRP